VRVLGMCRVSCAGLGVPTTRTRTYGSGLYTAVQNRVNMVHGILCNVNNFIKFRTTDVLTPVFYLAPGYGQPLDNVHLQHLNKVTGYLPQSVFGWGDCVRHCEFYRFAKTSPTASSEPMFTIIVSAEDL
jgi:hypothetical protein